MCRRGFLLQGRLSFADIPTENWAIKSGNSKGADTMAEKAYCVKCKAKAEMKNAKQVKMKNGRPAMKGVCAKCGTGMYKIIAKK